MNQPAKANGDTPVSSLRKRLDHLLAANPGDGDQASAVEIRRLVDQLDRRRVESEQENERLRGLQQELEAARNHYVDLYESAPLGYLTLDRKARIQEINRTGARLLGTEPAKLTGRSLSHFVARGDKKVVRDSIARCIDEARVVCFEAVLESGAGGVLYVLFDSVPQIGADNVDQCRTVMIDLTERNRTDEESRKFTLELQNRVDARTAQLEANLRALQAEIHIRHQAEEALRESEQKYRALAEKTNDIPYVMTLDGVLTYVGPQTLRYGLDPEQAIGKSFLEIIVPEDRHRVAWEFERTIHTREEFPTEFRYRSPQGEVSWFEDRGKIQRDSAGAAIGMTGVLRDITERKQLEAALAEAAERERREIGQELHDGIGQELTGLGYLAATLRARLNALGSPEAPAADELLRGLQDTLEHVRTTTRGLVPVEIDAQGLMTALEQMVDHARRVYGIPCQFRCHSRVEVADGIAATQLYRIAQEALSNAARHSGAAEILVSLEADSQGVALSIRDDGRGISLPSPLAMGMGLRIMRHRATLIGATLKVAPLDEGGTLVRCTLPRETDRDGEQLGQ